MKKVLCAITFLFVAMNSSLAQEVLRCDTVVKDGKTLVRKIVSEFIDGKKVVSDSLFVNGKYVGLTQTNWFAYEGTKMPRFSIKTEDGKVITSESLRGKAVVLSFWISSCAPCLKELNRVGPEIIDVQPKDQFVFLAVGSGETAEAAKKFRERSGASFPLCYDETGNVINSFADSGFPKLFLIDRNGFVRYIEKGYSDEKFALLKQKIDEVMNE